MKAVGFTLFSLWIDDEGNMHISEQEGDWVEQKKIRYRKKHGENKRILLFFYFFKTHLSFLLSFI